MENTTNSFTGGLNQDLHPIATPSDVLTDSKNGTFITFNGNEMSLQNDMGNTKLMYTPLNSTDKEPQPVALPKGYIPIGMKEHGGILYIISKNDETGSVQIGSFPSPEHIPEDVINLITPEKQITSAGTYHDTDSKEQSKVFDIELSELYPCDVITDYNFFPLPFELINTAEERRLFKYRLINNLNKKDITDVCPPFNFKNQIRYLTYKTKDVLEVVSPNLNITVTTNSDIYKSKYNCIANKLEGNVPTDLKSYAYGHHGEQYVSFIYLDIEDDVTITCSIENVSNSLVRTGFSTRKPEFKYGGNTPFYYPNLEKGQLAFQFSHESIDYFNLYREDDQGVIRFSPKLGREAQKMDTVQMDEVIEKINNELFQPDSHDYNTFRAYQGSLPEWHVDAKDGKMKLFIMSDPLAWMTPTQYTEFTQFENNVFADLTYQGLDANGEGKWAHTVRQNNYVYSLKFDKMTIKQPSWVKVDDIVLQYEIYSKENNEKISWGEEQLSVSQYGDELKVDISRFSIPIIGPKEKVKVGVAFVNDEDPRERVGIGSVSDDFYFLSADPFYTFTLPIEAKNYIVKLQFTPINTQYNIDLSQYSFSRTIDLEASDDSWEGEYVEMDHNATIEITLNNTVIYQASNGAHTLQSLKDFTVESLHNTDLAQTEQKIRYTLVKDKDWYPRYHEKYGNHEGIHHTGNTKSEKPKYGKSWRTMSYSGSITTLKNTDKFLHKYFEWKGTVTSESTFVMLNIGNDDIRTWWTLQAAGGQEKKGDIATIKTDKTKRPSGTSVNIVSRDGGYDMSQITQTIYTERNYGKNNCLLHARGDKHIQCKVTPTDLKYLDNYPMLERTYSKLSYLNKDADLLPCDSNKKLIINVEEPSEISLFKDMTEHQNYYSLVPIVANGHSRSTVRTFETTKTISSSLHDNGKWSVVFYIRKGSNIELRCNAEVFGKKDGTHNTAEDQDSIDTRLYDIMQPIFIKSDPNLLYTRVALICEITDANVDNFSIMFKGNGQMINTIMHKTRIKPEGCADLRVQAMRLNKLPYPDNVESLRMAGEQLNMEYIPLPYYEIINT